ncbi:hypothetical protein ABT093_00310 [Kitasatospora sp. NPDC002551]|uniref:hypothetical protein n=1 Tax=unclassified Kitasatospora TaxID=2633591 RepID=UPI00332C62A6
MAVTGTPKPILEVPVRTGSPALSPRPLPIPPLPAPSVPPRQPVPPFAPIGGRAGPRCRLRQVLRYRAPVPAVLLFAAAALTLGPAWAGPPATGAAPPAVGRTGCPSEGGENHP